MVTIFFTHVHVLQKAYIFFTTVISQRRNQPLIYTFIKNAYAFKDDDCIGRMCKARFRKSLEMSHDTQHSLKLGGTNYHFKWVPGTAPY
jgi:hypothetical protein